MEFFKKSPNNHPNNPNHHNNPNNPKMLKKIQLHSKILNNLVKIMIKNFKITKVIKETLNYTFQYLVKTNKVLPKIIPKLINLRIH